MHMHIDMRGMAIDAGARRIEVVIEGRDGTRPAAIVSTVTAKRRP
jgi:hypothetical protein